MYSVENVADDEQDVEISLRKIALLHFHALCPHNQCDVVPKQTGRHEPRRIGFGTYILPLTWRIGVNIVILYALTAFKYRTIENIAIMHCIF